MLSDEAGKAVADPTTVSICIPAYGQVEAGFAKSLSQMQTFNGGLVARDLLGDICEIWKTDTYVHAGRQHLAETAFYAQTDYILWIDSDMEFPRDALLRLMSHNLDIVGINYSMRGGHPLEFVAVKELATEVNHGQATRCVTMPESTGVEEVNAIGFGMVLMKMDVIETLMEKWPKRERGPLFWFEWLPVPGADDYWTMVGEDVYFCKLARRFGYKIWVDHDLSKECAHIGSFTYRPEHAQVFVGETKRIKRGVPPSPAAVAADMAGEPLIEVVK